MHHPPPPRHPDERLLAALPAATLLTDREGLLSTANHAAREVFGDRADTDHEPRPWVELFPAAERGAADEVLRKVLQGARWAGELPVLTRDGPARVMHLHVAPLVSGERVTGVLLVAEEVSGPRGRSQRLAERLTHLARVTAELLLATDVEGVSDIVTGHMADVAGATVSSLSLLAEPDRLRMVRIRGGREGAASRWQTYRLVGTPAGDSILSRRPLLLSGAAEIHSHYPGLEKAAEGERSLLCLPLIAGEAAVGVVTLSFPGRRQFDATEMEFFGVVADTCAQAVDRVQAMAEAADQAAKLQFLADATEELASSLDYEQTLRRVAELAVPGFADWCAIMLASDGRLRTLAVAHVDAEKLALAQRLQERYPPDPDSARGSYQVLRSGQSELIPEIADEMLAAAAVDDEHLAMLRALNFRSAISVPLKTRDEVLGVVTWVAGEEGRRFGPADLTFGEDLARRAAVAIDNARLHSELRDMARRLQRAVLPNALPRIEGWAMAAHYSPAGHLDAGGDFYDVIDLGQGRTAVFIGDVMGRGVHAAAAMAQMRSAVRTLVAVDPDPAAVLTRLDKVFRQYDIDQLVTMLYAVLEPEHDRILIANAGHLPPVVLRADGRIEPAPVPDELILGGGGCDRSAKTVAFGPGDSLLLFTDGLVERRGEDLQLGQDRVVAAARLLRPDALDASLTELVAHVSDPDRDDDVAALVLHRRG